MANKADACKKKRPVQQPLPVPEPQEISGVINEKTPFATLEAYKTIRTNVLFALAAQKSNIVVISSALPGEGKSTTCANLAVTMAQTQAKVLLIDADMRKPVQAKKFQRPNRKGLSSLLVGFDKLGDVLCKDVLPDLDLIPSGTIPPNPSELLGSENMSVLLEKMSECYDYIFIDTPPINIVSDAVILSGRAAGILLVTRQGKCTYDDITKAVESVEFAQANILGIVLNGVGDSGGRYGRYGKYKYKKKYQYYAYAED